METIHDIQEIQDLHDIMLYNECATSENFNRLSPSVQELINKVSDFALENNFGYQGLAIMPTIFKLQNFNFIKEAGDYYQLTEKKLCGDDFTLHFGKPLAIGTFFLYALYQRKVPEGTVIDDYIKHYCINIIAKVFPPGSWMTLEAVEKENQWLEKAHKLGVAPASFGVKSCEYNPEEVPIKKPKMFQQSKKKIYSILLMDKWGLGTLKELIQSGYYHKHSEEINRKLEEILDTLYENGIFHGDLHSGNFLFDKEMNFKVIDFGHTRQVKDKEKWSYIIEHQEDQNLSITLKEKPTRI